MPVLYCTVDTPLGPFLNLPFCGLTHWMFHVKQALLITNLGTLRLSMTHGSLLNGGDRMNEGPVG